MTNTTMTMSDNVNITPAQNVEHGDDCACESCVADARWTAIEALLIKMGVYNPEADLFEQFLNQAPELLELDRMYTDDEYQMLGAYVRWLIDHLNGDGWQTSAREIIETADAIAHATRKARRQYHRIINAETPANPGPFWF
jgi:hypothetical protein